jgi:hypothetical protein
VRRERKRVSVRGQWVNLAFCFTFHKVQGVTVSKIILDLAKRPSLLGRLDFHSVYVALSRVNGLDGIRLLPFRSSGDEHLRSFKAPTFPLMRDAMWLTPSSYSWASSVEIGKKRGRM